VRLLVWLLKVSKEESIVDGIEHQGDVRGGRQVTWDWAHFSSPVPPVWIPSEALSRRGIETPHGP
jgi:hypothetical protein